MSVTIYHNPKCGTSRNVLEVIKAAGYEPEIILYAQTGWTIEGLKTLFDKVKVTAGEALRIKGTSAEERGIDAQSTESDILAAMIEDPLLVNRPFVVIGEKAALCRPSEAVLDILPNWPKGPFAKEDGTLMIDANGQRVK